MWNFRLLIKDFRIQVALVLTGVWLISLVTSFSWLKLLYPILAVSLVSIFDVIFTLVKKQQVRFPSASLVTGLILGLVLFPFEHPLALPLAALAATFSKQFVRIDKRHIFNPAAFGIVVSMLVLGVSVPWWAAATSKLTIIVVLLGMGYILTRLKRILLPVTFLLLYGFYLIFRVGPEATLAFIFDPTTVFFSFIMLPELATSPAAGLWRFGFGPLTAASAIAISSLSILSETFLPGLLLANSLSFFAKSLSVSNLFSRASLSSKQQKL